MNEKAASVYDNSIDGFPLHATVQGESNKRSTNNENNLVSVNEYISQLPVVETDLSKPHDSLPVSLAEAEVNDNFSSYLSSTSSSSIFPFLLPLLTHRVSL